MSIFKETGGKKFVHYVNALCNEYGNNLQLLVNDSNKQIFSMRKKQTPYFKSLPLNKILTGRFYLINYNFNGNNLYCPIFTIDYRVSTNNKPNIYAINLDYLPYDYKKLYFGKICENYKQIIESNNDQDDVMEEDSLPVNFEGIYNSLKGNGGFDFAISAFDITKINECFIASTNILHVLMFVHMRKINIALMKQNMENYQMDDIKLTKLKYTVEELQKMEEGYENDVKTYYKRLKQLENNYKLFDN